MPHPMIAAKLLTPNGKGTQWAQASWPEHSAPRPQKREDTPARLGRFDMKVTASFGRPLKKKSRKGKRAGKDYQRNKSGHRKNPHKK